MTERDGFFDPGPVLVAAHAPGRIDVMGGIADYSGSLVLQRPTRAMAHVQAQWDRAEPPAVLVRTADPAAADGAAEVRIALGSLLGSYDEVRAALSADAGRRWTAYVAGAVTVLHQELGTPVECGIRMSLSSAVPAGKGVSSSAAIEVASMRALATLLDLSIPPRDLALLCQKVENLVVGAPCGVMDQMTASCGRPGELLALLCQPAELQPPVMLPPDVEVFALDSGIRHAVTGADYASVRVGAFMGYRILADAAGLAVRVEGGRVVVDDPAWAGYLANVTPEAWRVHLQDQVPERMRGSAFLERYTGTTDPVTIVDPSREYAVRQAAAHPVHEHARVRRFRDLMQSHAASASDAVMAELGDLMYASHASYGACGLGTPGTDLIVELVRQGGPAAGLFGARITGGGSGGTVAILGRPGSRATVHAIADRYTRETGRKARLIV